VAQQIYTVACELYAAAGLADQAPLRLVGVRATGLIPAASASAQLAFGDRPVSWREAERALDQIAGRFGTDAVRPAILVEGERPGS
jgi:DNA polymerase-4